MKRYDKLVRDRIPQIIREDGRSCRTRTRGQEEYLSLLEDKLREELDEYLQSGSMEELADLCVYLMVNTNEAAKNIETDDTLIVNLSGKLDLQSECIKAMEKLGEEYNSLSGFYPNAKPVLASEGMSCIRILGMYAPFTVEANYNVNAPDFAKPFTVCHELSHLKGFMREDEANYIAFLACIGSDNKYLNYAGWIYALLYAANAFYSAAGEEAYLQLMSYADEKVIKLRILNKGENSDDTIIQ